jgi:hypothetical protein
LAALRFCFGVFPFCHDKDFAGGIGIHRRNADTDEKVGPRR